MDYFSLLVVDDDDLIHQSIRMSLPKQWQMASAHSFKEIPDQKFNAAFVDMHLTDQPTAEGPEIIRRLSLQDPHLEIIAMSGDLNRELMEKCLKAGASRYLAKPLSPDEVTLVLDKIEALLLLQGAQTRKPSQVNWVGQSQASQQVRKTVANLKGEKGPILLDGESGSGKEVLAQLIHSQEGSHRPFIAVNTAAIPSTLFESEVFGHVRGAFTGADQNKMGLAEAAHGGDLFLDEIEALDLTLQAKLLRFLESGEVRRVGSQNPINVNVRVIAATNKNLDQMAKDGEFREDLLWRLNGQKISVPPLRERSADIEELCSHFFSQDKYRKKELDADSLTAMQAYSWPGNVRELRRVCEQLLISAPLPVIRKEDVLAFTKPQSHDDSLGAVDFSSGLPNLIENYEGHLLRQCLNKCNDIDDAARLLKISRSSLYKKIKDHDIDWRT